MSPSKSICHPTSRFIAEVCFAAALLFNAIQGSILAEGSAGKRTPISDRLLPYPVFTDVTASAGLNPTGFPFGDPIWGDLDNDGDLDLFVDNHYNLPPYQIGRASCRERV